MAPGLFVLCSVYHVAHGQMFMAPWIEDLPSIQKNCKHQLAQTQAQNHYLGLIGLMVKGLGSGAGSIESLARPHVAYRYIKRGSHDKLNIYLSKRMLRTARMITLAGHEGILQGSHLSP